MQTLTTRPQPLNLTGLRQCTRCPKLKGGVMNVVPGYGNLQSKIMFVAQSPGQEEKEKKIPLIGASGQLFTRALKAVGFDPDAIYKTNVNKCHPQGNRECSGTEISNCRSWLEQEVDVLDPDVIVAMGATAYKSFLPDETSSITQIQGNVYKRKIRGRDRWVIPTVHPAFVIRNEKAHMERFKEHLAKAKQILETGEYVVEHKPFRKERATWDEVLAASRAPVFGFDLETDDGNGDDVYETDAGLRRAKIIGVGLCAEEGNGVYYPFEDDEEAVLKMQELREALESPVQRKIVSNAKFERHVLDGIPDWGVRIEDMLAESFGIKMANYDDTLLESWILGNVPLSLKDGFHAVFGIEMIRIDKFKKFGKGGSVDLRAAMELIPEQVIEYAAQDADASFRLHSVLFAMLQERGLDDLYLNIELPFIEIIVAMEDHGMKFDASKLTEARVELTIALQRELDKITELVGRPLNPNSSPQVKQALYYPTDPYFEMNISQEEKNAKYAAALAEENRTRDKNLKVIKYAPPIFDDHPYQLQIPRAYYGKGKNAGKLPTDRVELAEFVENPLIIAILTARALKKMLGTYIDGLPKQQESDGYIRCNLNQTRAGTGRMSSSNPNLQNIPSRKRDDVDIGLEGSAIRKAFIAEPWAWLIAPDLSQIEMRFAAHLANDAAMIRELDGGDIHSNTARAIYGTDEEAVGEKRWKEMRYLAKTIGFGTLYGLTAHGLLKRTPTLQLTVQEAARFISLFYDAYPRLRDYQKEVIRFCRENGYAETISGRRRYLPDITASDDGLRSEAERAAINVPIQGSAADFFKRSCLAVWKLLEDLGLETKMASQVHDELILHGPRHELRTLAQTVPAAMESSYKLAVPVPIDFEYGYNWGELFAYKEWEIDRADLSAAVKKVEAEGFEWDAFSPSGRPNPAAFVVHGKPSKELKSWLSEVAIA